VTGLEPGYYSTVACACTSWNVCNYSVDYFFAPSSDLMMLCFSEPLKCFWLHLLEISAGSNYLVNNYVW
jgi:hypothetical protein